VAHFGPRRAERSLFADLVDVVPDRVGRIAERHQMLSARGILHAKAEGLISEFLVCSGHCSGYTVATAKVQELNAASAAAPFHPLPEGRGLAAQIC
jgi:hypothetical protein